MKKFLFERLPEILGVIALVAIVLLVMSCVGCKSSGAAPIKLGASINNAGKSTARIEVRSEVITDQAKLLPKSQPRETIIEQAGGVKADAVEAASELDKAQVNINLMAGSLNNQAIEIAVLKAEIAALNKRWIAPRLASVVRWLIVGIIAAGFISTFLGVASPSGWGLWISRAINANIMLPFVWIRDFILRLRGLKVSAVPTPVASQSNPV